MRAQTAWLNEQERLLGGQEPLFSGDEDIIREAQTTNQTIADEINSRHHNEITPLLNQCQSLLLSRNRVFATDTQRTELESNFDQLSQKIRDVSREASDRAKNLQQLAIDLGRYSSEASRLTTWLASAENRLGNVESVKLSEMKQTSEQFKSLHQEGMSKDADFKYLGQTAQKLLKSLRKYNKNLEQYSHNTLRSQSKAFDPQQLDAQEFKESHKQIADAYTDLMNRLQTMIASSSEVANAVAKFENEKQQVGSLLANSEKQLQTLAKANVSSANPDQLRDQAGKLRSFSTELSDSWSDIDKMKRAADDLAKAVELSQGFQVETADVQQVQQTTESAKNRLTAVQDNVGEKAQQLEAVILQTQGLEDRIKSIDKWLQETKAKADLFSIPATVDKMAAAAESFKLLKNEYEQKQPDVAKLLDSMDEVQDDAKLKQRGDRIRSNNEALGKKIQSLSSDMDQAQNGLVEFEKAIVSFKDWLGDAKKLNGIDNEESKRQLLDKLKSERDDKIGALEKIREISNGLLEMAPGVLTDPSAIRQKVVDLEQSWQQAQNSIDEQTSKQSQLDECSQEFAGMSEQFQKWLTDLEQKVDGLPPVSYDLDQLERVNDELNNLMVEWDEQQPTMDELIDVATTLEALQQGEQPLAISKRMNRIRRIRSSSRLTGSKSRSFGSLAVIEGGGTNIILGSTDSMTSAFEESGSPIEQELRNANFRFMSMKERLGDRRQEVAQLVDGIRAYKRDAGAITDWLQTKEAMLESNALPQSPSDAAKMLKAEKDANEDVLGRLHEFASVQRRMEDLMRNAPPQLATNDTSRDEIHGEIRAIDRRIANVREQSNAKRNDLQAFIDDDKRFHDLNRSLMSWLQQKEKMLLVIGAVTAEPTLVRSQLQQLELLSDELSANHSELDQLKQLGAQLLEQCDPNGEYGKQVQQDCDGVANKWQQVEQKLNEKHDMLKRLLDRSVGFYQRLQETVEWGQNAQMKLEDLAAAQGPVAEEELSELEEQLAQQEVKLQSLKHDCDELYDEIGEPTFDLRNKLASAERPMSDVRRKVSNMKAEIQRNAAQQLKTKEQIKRLLSWLGDMQSRLSAVAPLSGLEEVLEQQITQIQSIHEELDDNEIDIRQSVKAVLKSEEATGSEQEKQQAQKLRSDFNNLKQQVQEKLTKRRQMLKSVQKFQLNASSLQSWLSSLERSTHQNRLLPTKKDQINNMKRELKTVQNELLRRSHEFDMFLQLGGDILQEITTDSEHIEKLMEGVKDRWQRLSEDVQTESQKLDDFQQELGEILDQIQDISVGLSKCEEKHDAQLAQGSQNVDKIQAVREEMLPLVANANQLLQTVSNFCSEYPVENSEQLIEDVSMLNQRSENVERSLADSLGALEVSSKLLNSFEDLLGTFRSILTDAQNELDNIGPVARDMNSLQTQFEEIRGFVSNLEGQDGVSEAERRGRELVEGGLMTSDNPLNGQVSALRKQWDQLVQAATDRERRVLETLGNVQQFQEQVTDCQNGISAAAVEFHDLKPPAGDVANINRLQEEYQTFHKNCCENMDDRIAEAVRLGRELCASAEHSVDCSGIQGDLDLIQDKWNDLKGKFSDYQQRLNDALVKSGQFRDALSTLCNWLQDTEQLIAGQKAPSVDYNLIRAQMQEQKLLQHMISERAPTIEQMSRMAEQVSAQAERGDREKILEDMRQGVSRWQAINSAANNRQRDLEQIYDEAKIVHDRYAPLCEWLDRVAGEVDSSKSISLAPAKLKENIGKYQVCTFSFYLFINNKK